MSKIIAEHQAITRKRTFQVRGLHEIGEVMEIVKREKFTGSVAIAVTQGSAQAINLEERAKLSLDNKGVRDSDL